MIKVLMEFHHRAARRITGITARHGASREWEYPAVEEAMDYARIHPIRLYIKRRQKTIAEKVVCRPVYVLRTEVERMQMVRW